MVLGALSPPKCHNLYLPPELNTLIGGTPPPIPPTHTHTHTYTYGCTPSAENWQQATQFKMNHAWVCQKVCSDQSILKNNISNVGLKQIYCTRENSAQIFKQYAFDTATTGQTKLNENLQSRLGFCKKKKEKKKPVKGAIYYSGSHFKQRPRATILLSAP